MDNLQDIEIQEQSMGTLVGLTNVFESIASIQIARVKNQTILSKAYFSELWRIYNQIRVDSDFHMGRAEQENQTIKKDLIVIITAEGGFSGDIDEKLISVMLQKYDEAQQDIIVIGHHGAIRLAQLGVHFKRYYKLPTHDSDINVNPIVNEAQKYRSTLVYYQTYVSLMVQDIKHIELKHAVEEEGQAVAEGEEEISEQNYIFEPSSYAVIDHLERSMMHITLSQVILESKLAQYASRFRAMNSAKDKAKTSLSDVKMSHNKVKRRIRDERIKETINSLRSLAR